MALSTSQSPATEPQPTQKPGSVTKGKPKGYKRIKFKSWQPTAESDPHDINGGRTKWRLNRHVKRSATDASLNSSATQQAERKTVVITAHTYRCPTPLQHRSLPENGHRQDPFVTLPIEATPDVTSAMDFFLATCVPENKQSEWLVGKPNPHMALLFPFMLKDAMLFEIVVVLCRASILMAQGKKVKEDRPFVLRRAHAIKTITNNLTSPQGISDASLLSITMVLTLEYLTGNVAAVAAHLDGIQQMLQLREDLDGSTPWKRFVRAGVLAYQSLGCFVTGKPMNIPGTSPGYVKEAFNELGLNEPLSYPGLPFSPELCTSLSRLPPAFAELCLCGNVSKQIMNFLAFAQATTNLLSHMDEADERVDHEIQVMLAALQRLGFAEKATIESYLVCGLLAYAFQLRQLRSLNIFHDPPLRHFIDQMRKHEKPDSKRAQDTMIWISISVGGALGLRTMAMPGGHEVLDRMFRLYPESSNWSYVDWVLKAHFWTESLGRHWEKVWSTGFDRWTIVKNQSIPSELKLIYPGSRPEDDLVDGPSITFDQTIEHTRSAAYSIAHMMDAAKRCPFQARLGPSMQMPELDGMSMSLGCVR
ncbi:uncharacterized protein AB675_2887 [Cyphellophora attinorum]|uniref:Transcription factor domain-containing protein n=1 Tax=Cyphellophora attinorum TaxID=1664694 RepID=A0A0N1HN75_9EURO|nr:uncharacterized protein AB675_2887 [Phialophora attinorum]KPI36416.1 hypothetical protein AB675_2887 [Phialophora attinorum]